MKIEFKYDEVIDFIKCHSLLSMSLEERLQTLIESGIIEEENPLEAAKQEYNQEIKDGLVFSLLIKNSFWEATIKEITGNDIRIVDHNDEDITGVNCDACGYIVFEDKEDAFMKYARCADGKMMVHLELNIVGVTIVRWTIIKQLLTLKIEFLPVAGNIFCVMKIRPVNDAIRRVKRAFIRCFNTTIDRHSTPGDVC